MLTVVYDADCGVCQASVAFLRARDRSGVFRFVGNGEEPLPAGVTREETAHTVVVLDDSRDGQPLKLVRAAAAARLLRELPRYRALAFLLRAPGLRALADLAYDAFARRRHRISAALGLRACAIPWGAAAGRLTASVPRAASLPPPGTQATGPTSAPAGSARSGRRPA